MTLPAPVSVPVEGGKVISRQGPRPGRRTWHNGIDIVFLDERGRAQRRIPVFALAAGTVESVNACGYSCSYGNTVVVRHNPDELSVYAHLLSVSVAEGASVAAGELLGLIGDTTSLRAGMVPHLHLELVRSWRLASDDFESRYDVLHELAAAGVVLDGDVLVAGEPAAYEEPLLAAGKGPGTWRVIVAPEEPQVDPGPAWIVPTAAVVVAVGIFLATAFVLPGRKLGYHPAVSHAPPSPCTPWRSVIEDGQEVYIETQCAHRSRLFRQARVWPEAGGVRAAILDGSGRQLQTQHHKVRWEALRWAEFRLPAGKD